MTTLRLAIVGAGPAGIYAADILLKAERAFDVSIDLFEQLPAPYGLVRYGVAPDHPRIKGVITALREVLDRGDIRIFGNVEFGRDITLDDLKRHYNAVIFATGAVRDATLDIPGIDAEGSYGAADFVSWFDGHPDVPRTWPLTAQSVAVVGNGNVALDITRILAKHADDLLPTEIPANVYEGLKASPVTDVHVFGRRGPAQVKFTPLELRELGELRDVDMVVYDEDFDYDEASRTAIESNKQVKVIDRVLQEWRTRPGVNNAGGTASRRLHLHFWARPVEVKVDDRGHVSGFVYERTRPDGQGGVAGTGEFREVPVQAVYRAVGYFGSPLPEVPFDERHGVIPNHEGQVLRADSNERAPGLYATGWIKRGPVGLIGHTKSDAMETVRHLINDQGSWWQPEDPSEAAIPALLAERGVAWTDLEGWHRLDQHEIGLGEPEGRARIKVVPRDEMVAISRGE
ncbi:MAG TPA: pyridine nucleotide-disulfide oxidoreductase [Microbacterium sp.]|uniref:FAD-dependent oxidoreductase n=1 Tax=Microbacterium TaxID=33882 RepID=UPI000C3BEA75|nr:MULTISPECIES: FAD-dependent oxidoreductase [Microbacterium]MBU20048.1 pyridine nucleotide-disulfide oxidoreductase [Microbacterium sp.]MCC4267390.1 FAD-dependent oxidoreductase [Microbacterium schleiferi]HAJ17117.1 pyridine nucleotide-disulfide oxidoreductase [Microbacterium sp.]HBS10019.1 pyridine nucleotide-disulfide oxidoreductase [Microbacterium sp.]HBU42369.1 pyridine nucleotide-disulfide oxidoreductase [Microbacterium sp.]|tara:strand:- start:2655 stop:4028 length:1374 start_codon:yes stop_codon:yes gene_type:complete